MARKTQYACDINGEYFPTAKSIEDRCRQILAKYQWPGCPLEVEMSDDDAGFFVELVRLRDPGRIPEGTYVRQVLRTDHKGQIGNHVAFVYGNGVRDCIGWQKLKGGKPKDPAKITAALRETICYQTLAVYKEAFGGGLTAKCAKTGVDVSVQGELYGALAVVHHDGPPFAKIRDMWLEQEGITLDQVPIMDLQIGGYAVAPGRLAESWKAFHAAYAQLMVVSKPWHDRHHFGKAEGEWTDDEETARGQDAGVMQRDPSEAAVNSALDRVGLHGLPRRQEASQSSAPA